MSGNTTESNDGSGDNWLGAQVTKYSGQLAWILAAVAIVIGIELPNMVKAWNFVFHHGTAAANQTTAAHATTGGQTQSSAAPAVTNTVVSSTHVVLPAPDSVIVPAATSQKWSKPVPVPGQTKLCLSFGPQRQWHDRDYPLTATEDGHWHDFPADGNLPATENGERYRGLAEQQELYFNYIVRTESCPTK